MSSYPVNEMKNNYYAFNYASTLNLRYKSRSKNGTMIGNEDHGSEYLGIPMTIIIPPENISQLQFESEIKQVSLNTKINQIIKDHLDWHADAHEAKMYYVPRSLITNTVNHLTEQQLSVVAQSVVNDFRDMSLLLRGEYTFSSFFDILNIWLKITETPNRFEESEHEYKVVIRHGMGYKYSYFIKEVYRQVIELRYHKSIHYNITDNSVVIGGAK
jgi:hypothetical protein